MSPKPYTPPNGRIQSKRRRFDEVVRDLRHAVYSVIRHRPIGNNQNQAFALGSGFFVSPTVFLTCNHVINGLQFPHQDGDAYQLVSNVTGVSGNARGMENVRLGQQLQLFPDQDLALLIFPEIPGFAYAALEFGDVPVGQEIGVAGYPLARLALVEDQLRYDGLIFRVAKGVVTSTYVTNIDSDQGRRLAGLPIIEVNFLFVPGNSGGPVFDAETGRVSAFVHGYATVKIREKVETVSLVPNLPAGVNAEYIESTSALYSLALKLECVRAHLERFGVVL
jgi:hypothetical protein